MKVQELRQALRELAIVEETSAPVISVHLGVGGGVTAMLQRLRELALPLLAELEERPRTEAELAITGIEQWIEANVLPMTRGIAVFARAGEEPFLLPLQFRTDLPDSVDIDGLPSLYHLCDLRDSHDCYVILLASESSVRVLEVHLGAVIRQVWRERPEPGGRSGREWTKEHLASRRRAQSQRLVREMVDVLQRTMDEGGYRHLVLAGNPRVLATVRETLPKRLRERVIDQLAIPGHAPVEEIVHATLGTFLEEEQRESASMVEELLTRFYRDGLAVVGEERSFRALLHDQAERLVLTRDFAGPARDELLRMAERSGCGIEFVEDSERLARVGGVGCLLRYRAPEPAVGCGA